MKRVLTTNEDYGFLDDAAKERLAAWRPDLGELRARAGSSLQFDGDTVPWWTFAGGRINHTLKYALEWKGGFKVAADNFALKLKGDGIGAAAVDQVVQGLRDPAFWCADATRQKLRSLVPEYRLSKFQDVLPDKWQVEVVGSYMLDFEGAETWLAA